MRKLEIQIQQNYGYKYRNHRIVPEVLDFHQASLPGFSLIEDELGRLAESSAEQRGAIFTRSEVVHFILDLVGYTPDKPLHQQQILEPSFGDSDFLLIIVDRLLKAWRAQKTKGQKPTDLESCIRAVELHTSSVINTRKNISNMLMEQGVDAKSAKYLIDAWLVQGDFLLTPFPDQFDYVVGNPPYIRQELIPDVLITEYRRRYKTIYDRADIYVAFIERSLSLLKENGALGFICADRWMKNRYGGPLRRLIAEQFNLMIYVDMVDTDAFLSEVSAYPAITVITKESAGKTRVAYRPKITQSALSNLTKILLSPKSPRSNSKVHEVADVTSGSEPWLLDSLDQLSVVRRLEALFPLLEDAGCKVGIGVATGADKAFIGPYDELDVEADRKLPIAMTRDILSGEVEWQGQGIINPFADAGGLVDLGDYPKLKAYLEERKDQIAKRHVAKKAPQNWYRTIDRIYPSLAKKPKLLIPDIKSEAHIVHEDGNLYPHHNLYYITSDEWNLHALQAVLLSDIARLFVATYSTQMRGGYLRFQAQYLRRIRLPRWETVPSDLKKKLIRAAKSKNIKKCMSLTFEVYGLSKKEQLAVCSSNNLERVTP